MKNKSLKIISSILSIANGILFIMFSEHILNYLPTISGLIMIVSGIVGFIAGIKNKDYSSIEQKGMEKSIVVFVIGVGILIRQENALFIVGIFWGLHGLVKATNYLNVALYHISRKEKFLADLCKWIVEFVLSVILIFDPFSSVGHHIVILGVEIILDTVLDLLSEGKEYLTDFL